MYNQIDNQIINEQCNRIDNSFLNQFERQVNTHYVTIILNRPQQSEMVKKLRQLSHCLICADGGANRLYNIESSRSTVIPDGIVGDLDSLKSHVRDYYEKEHNVTVIQQESQDSTDLQKSIQYLQDNNYFDNEDKKRKTLRIIVSGAFGGRLDHTFCNISSLLNITKSFQNNDIYGQIIVQMMDEFSLATCLLPGEHLYSRAIGLEKIDGVGIIPLEDTAPHSIQSKGLKWELDECHLQLGQLISSSNEFSESLIEDNNCHSPNLNKDKISVFIKTKHPLLFITCVSDDT